MIRPLALILIFPLLAYGAKKSQLAELTKQAEVINQSIEVTRNKIKDNRDLSVLPDLYMTLADFQTQKATLSFAIKREKNPKTPIAELDSTAEKRMKEDAIETYNLIITRFSTYRDADKAHFYMAHEYKEINEPEKALGAYKKLTDNFPKSPLWEAAQFAIGNHYFEKKDFDFALKMLAKVVERPENPYTALAQFRMGWCHINKAKWLQALEQFEKVYTSKSSITVAAVPGVSSDSDIKEESMVASVWPMLELAPEVVSKNAKFSDPVAYYKRHAMDDNVFLKVLNRLARRLQLKKRHREAANALYLALQLTANPEQKIPLLEDFYLTNRDQKLSLWPEGYIQQVVDSLEHADAATLKKYEPLARDVATQMHILARSTKRAEDIDQTVDAYSAYFYLYPRSPKKIELQLNYAEALFNSKRFIQAALKYESLARVSKKDSKALANSALQAYIEGLKDHDKLSRLDRLQGQAGFERLSKKFIDRWRNDPAVPGIEFNLSKLYFDKREFDRARQSLRNYVTKYPDREETEQAALMLLDTFYQENDLKNLSKEGDSLLAQARLNSKVKGTIKDMVETAKLRRVRALAGDFGSKQYSENLLQLAQSSTDKSVGESALYEAFLSAKSRKDPKTYSIGETYLSRFPNSAKAASVDLELIQMAMQSANFRLAARYMEGYNSRHPQDNEAGSYLSQAETIYSQLQSLSDLQRITRKTGNVDKLARTMFLQRRWNELERIANQARGVSGTYYQGIAIYRSGNKSKAMELLNRVAASSPSSQEETDAVAHARFLNAMMEFDKARAQWKPQVISPAILKGAATQAQEVERNLQSVLELQKGNWVVGSLYMLGRLQLELARFFQSAQPPPGMSPQQLQQALSGQVKTAQNRAQEFFTQCRKIAVEKQIFTRFTAGCAQPNGALISEADEFPVPSPSRVANDPQLANLQQAVAAASDDVGAWFRLAERLFSTQAYNDAELVLMRLIESKDRTAQAWAALGVVRLHLGDTDGATSALKKAKEIEPTQPLANHALNRLSTKFSAASGRQPAMRKPSGVWTHRWLE